LCNAQGQPLSIEVFTGNTNDTATMASQIRKVAERFGVTGRFKTSHRRAQFRGSKPATEFSSYNA
ncbi:MAG TPA: hypothetical protein VNG91_08530, partial [Terriglobia bacterium]|nr:hypothetical protein [Terriglobia bacterium]